MPCECSFKIAVSLVLILAMCLAMGSVCYADDRAAGASFEQTRLVAVDRPFDSVPLTFEAWVCVPKTQTARAGVILGNYKGSGNVPCINFEIHKNGRPRLYIIDTKKTAHDFIFSAADARPDTATYNILMVVISVFTGTAVGVCIGILIVKRKKES